MVSSAISSRSSNLVLGSAIVLVLLSRRLPCINSRQGGRCKSGILEADVNPWVRYVHRRLEQARVDEFGGPQDGGHHRHAAVHPAGLAARRRRRVVACCLLLPATGTPPQGSAWQRYELNGEEG